MLVKKPIISICIPTHNGSKHIFETIKSVLNQTFKDFEIVISDDGSNDETIQIIKSFNDSRITKIDCLEPGTPADNWNNSVRLASGIFIKLLCQDDVIFPMCLEKEVKAMSDPVNADCSFCFHTRNLITETGRHVWDPIKSSFRAGKYSIDELLPRIVRSGGNPIGQPMAVTFRAEALEMVGEFEGDFVIDLDMWVKLLEVGRGLALGEVLSAFRVNGDSWGIELSKVQFKKMYDFNLKMRTKHPNIVSRLDSEKGRLKCFVRTFARRFASRWVFRD